MSVTLDQLLLTRLADLDVAILFLQRQMQSRARKRKDMMPSLTQDTHKEGIYAPRPLVDGPSRLGQ